MRFVATLDPNGASDTSTAQWPEYAVSEAPQILAFLDGKILLKIIPDTFRKEAVDFVQELSLTEPL